MPEETNNSKEASSENKEGLITDPSNNSDVIRKIIEHHYFQYLVKEQVNAQTKAYVAKWWKFVTIVGGLALSTLGFFVGREYISFKEKIGEIEKENQRVKQLVNDSTALLAQTQTLEKNAKDTVDLAEKYIASSREMAQNTSELAKQTGDYTKGLLESLSQRQNELRQAHSRLEQDLQQSTIDIDKIKREKIEIESLKDHINQIKAQIEIQKNDVTNASADVNGQKSEINKKHGEILKAADQLQKSLNFQQELAKAKTFEVVVIRQGGSQSGTVKLPDFREIEKENPRLYTLKFTAVTIKNHLDIDIQVDSGDLQNFRHLKKGDSRNIEGTPFFFRVDSIYHAKLAFDFAVLRVNPKADRTATALQRIN